MSFSNPVGLLKLSPSFNVTLRPKGKWMGTPSRNPCVLTPPTRPVRNLASLCFFERTQKGKAGGMLGMSIDAMHLVSSPFFLDASITTLCSDKGHFS